MGQDISIDGCCGMDGRAKTETDEQTLTQSWEIEALESWENLDPITYYQYVENRSMNEEKRHRAMQKARDQQKRRPEKVRSYLQEVDDCFDELFGIPLEEPIKYEQNVEMIPMQAASLTEHHHKTIPPPGSYTMTAEDLSVPTERASSTADTTSTTLTNLTITTTDTTNNKTTTLKLQPSANNRKSQKVVESRKSVRQPYVSDEQRDQILQLETNYTGWSSNQKEFERTPLRVWEPTNLGWPPYRKREFKVVHLVKGSIECVWKAWNDVELRKTYDDSFAHARIVEKVDNSCDGQFVSLCCCCCCCCCCSFGVSILQYYRNTSLLYQ